MATHQAGARLDCLRPCSAGERLCVAGARSAGANALADPAIRLDLVDVLSAAGASGHSGGNVAGVDAQQAPTSVQAVTEVTDAGVVTFTDNNDGYRTWLYANPTGVHRQHGSKGDAWLHKVLHALCARRGTDARQRVDYGGLHQGLLAEAARARRLGEAIGCPASLVGLAGSPSGKPPSTRNQFCEGRQADSGS